MAKIRIRKLRTDDLSKLPAILKKHLFYIKPDRSIDRSSPQKLIKQLYFHSILNVPLSLLGLDTFVGSVAQANDGNIVGAIIARRFPLGKSWVIGPVVVAANFRRLNVATRMMNFTVKHLMKKKATGAILSVERSNTRGRRFFEKFGFRYLEPIFNDHDRARNYARLIALTRGYLQYSSYKIKPLRRRNTNSLKMKTIRMWHVMLKEF